MRIQKIFMVVAFALAASLSSVEASEEAKQQYVEAVQKMISTNWEPLQFAAIVHTPVVNRTSNPNALDPRYNDPPPPDRRFDPILVQPIFSFQISRNGTISNLKLVRSSGIAATDLACEDAILCSSPIAPIPAQVKAPLLLKCNFGEQLQEKLSIASTLHCCDYHSGLGVDSVGPNTAVFRFHLIPVAVLNRYPAAIKVEKIHSLNNIGELPISAAEQQLRALRKQWTKFFLSHKTATSDEIASKETQLQRSHIVSLLENQTQK